MEISDAKKLFEEYVDAKIAEYDAKLAEQKRDYDAKLAEQKRELAEQKQDYDAKLSVQGAKIEELEQFVDNIVDPRLKFWNDGESSSASTKNNSEVINSRINYRSSHLYCFGCNWKGGKNNDGTGLSTAHIIASSADREELFGSTGPNNYKDDIVAECERNYLVLCGSKGDKFSCHDAYDHLKISLYFDKNDEMFKWFVYRPDFVCGHVPTNLNGKMLSPAEIGDKYVRLLNWRTIRTIIQPGRNPFSSASQRSEFISMLQDSEEPEIEHGHSK
jgi:hypothetical protein